MKRILVGLLFIFATLPAAADYEFFRGVRQMGMGGASIAVVNDETSVLSNPNGLGRLRDYFYTLVDPEVTGSTSQTDTLLESLIVNSVIPDKTYDLLSNKQGTPYYFKGQVFPSIVVPNFGVGLLGRYEITALRNADGTMDYNYQNDYSLNLAYNMRFWGGRVKLGFAGRLINRLEFAGNFDPMVDSLAVSTNGREGMGISVDTGLTIAAPWKWLPTLTVLVRDVGGTSFTFGNGLFQQGNAGDPAMVQQSIDVAVALFPILNNHSRMVFTVEYTGIDNMNNVTNQLDRLHIGTEFNFYDAYFLRLGYHENDWTAGFEYAWGIFQLQMATYSEQISIGTLTDRDRRGVLKFGVRF